MARRGQMCEESVGRVLGLVISSVAEVSKGFRHWVTPPMQMWRRGRESTGWVREEGWVEGEGQSGAWGSPLMTGYERCFSLCVLLVTDPTSSGLRGVAVT